MTLDQIGNDCQTDKGSSYHDYLRHYEALFGGQKDSFTAMLEIGVLHGASMKMWRRWLPKATIVGVDIHPQWSGPEAIVETADASKADHIIPIAKKYGPFDLIVDDGSHFFVDQRASLAILYSFLKPGGYYIIEDVPHGESRFGGTAVCGMHRDVREDFVWIRAPLED